jgi:hypothetical protein
MSLSPEQLVTSESRLAFTRNCHLRREDYPSINLRSKAFLVPSTRKRLIDVPTLIYVILERGKIRSLDSAVGIATGYGLKD